MPSVEEIVAMLTPDEIDALLWVFDGIGTGFHVQYTQSAVRPDSSFFQRWCVLGLLTCEWQTSDWIALRVSSTAYGKAVIEELRARQALMA